MSEDRLAQAARSLLEDASDAVEVGDRRERASYVLVPAYALRYLREAMTPEQGKEPASYVVIDPKMKFGQPTLRGRRLTAEFLAEHYWHLGSSLESEVLGAYDITRADLLACCHYVARYGSRTWRKRWKAWLDASWENTGIDRETDTMQGWWSEAFSDVPLPPHKDQSAAEPARREVGE